MPKNSTTQPALFNIGEASRQSGVSRKMIRHYETIGLLAPANRTAANYRLYASRDIHELRFIKHARDLGFSMHQIHQLVSLWRDDKRQSSEVKALTLAHIREIDQQISKLENMRQTLQQLARQCHGDRRPDCPILDELEQTS
jgi:MerR family transcriptional regulator, copper efflux regulator